MSFVGVEERGSLESLVFEREISFLLTMNYPGFLVPGCLACIHIFLGVNAVLSVPVTQR